MGIKFFWMFAFQFLGHMAKKLAFFSKRTGGADRFIDNFDEDHILPLTAFEAERIPEFQGCTGCGLCDAVCPLTGQVVDGQLFSIATLASTTWRDATAHHLVAEGARAFLASGDPDACESVCPEGVPLRALAEHVARDTATER